jgi:hypothetical protein
VVDVDTDYPPYRVRGRGRPLGCDPVACAWESTVLDGHVQFILGPTSGASYDAGRLECSLCCPIRMSAAPACVQCRRLETCSGPFCMLLMQVGLEDVGWGEG